MEYRREIDGLRAVAVLPVILFHAGFKLFGGGFVGVDVFFVISGYLITKIILSDLETNKFSIIKFYERRARRIIPALFFVIVCCIPLAWFWLTPFHLLKFSQGLIAVSCFSSNIFFWLDNGYFSPTSGLIPLLHTWSLGVEEQFYMVFPLFLVAIWKKCKRWAFSILTALTLASLALCEWGAYLKPSATFYLLPTREWELAIGALIAIYWIQNTDHITSIRSKRVFCECLGALGLILIFYSIYSFNEKTHFPSVLALIPTIGTALIIIFSTKDTFVGRILSTKAMVGIGIISYSVYLWHQPIFAFARHRFYSELNTGTLLLLSFFSIFAGYFSWRYIESPFRDKILVTRKCIFNIVVFGSFLMIFLGLFGYYTTGFDFRNLNNDLPADYLSKTHRSVNNVGIDGGKCVSDSATICKFFSANSHKNFLLVGDSHSSDYSSEFSSYVKNNNVNGWQLTINGCGMLKSQINADHNCNEAVQLLKSSVKEVKFDKIFFISNLMDHTHGLSPKELNNDINSFVQLIKELRSNATDMVMFTPRYSLNTMFPIQHAIFGELDAIHYREEGYNEEKWTTALTMLSVQNDIELFDQKNEIKKFSCGKFWCFNGHDENKYALYFDSNHLTAHGAKIVWESYKRNFPN